MTTPEYPFEYKPETAVAYQPTDAQRQRAMALRRFNRLYLYLPVGFAIFIAIFIIGLLLWSTFSGDSASTRTFISGLADVIIILTVIPLTFICALPAIIATAVFIHQRQKPKSEFPRLQILIWKVDNFVSRLQRKANEVAPRAADPVIKSHGFIVYLDAWRKIITQFFTRR